MKKIKLLFVDYKLVIGGAEQALFDLIHLLDKDKFDITLFVQSPGGDWEERFWKAGVKIVYDYSCRKPTLNPIQKAKNAIKKLQTDAAYKRDGEGLLDVVLEQKPDIIISYSAWGYDQLTFAKNAKSVKYIHGDPGTDPVYRCHWGDYGHDYGPVDFRDDADSGGHQHPSHPHLGGIFHLDWRGVRYASGGTGGQLKSH